LESKYGRKIKLVLVGVCCRGGGVVVVVVEDVNCQYTELFACTKRPINQPTIQRKEPELERTRQLDLFRVAC
jgi:hypothetical protein